MRARSIAVVTILAIAASACDGDDNEPAAVDAGSDDSDTGDGSSTAPDTTTVTTPPGTTIPGDPCDPLATLVTVVLNDRCTLHPGVVPTPEEFGSEFVQSAPVWTVASCESLLAAPNQVVIVVGPTADMGAESARVIDVFANAGITAADGDEIPPDAKIITLDENATPEAVLNLLPALQGLATSVDLNYLEPVLPHNRFRPADDPMPANPEQIAEFTSSAFTGADGKNVAVIDTTGDQSVYDIDGNHYIDEDHGHGPAVESIVERASEATVALYPVTPDPASNNPSLLPTGRWAPMLMQDSDIIRTLQTVDPIPHVVNMSLGGAGCEAGAGFAWGIGERLALARKMNNLRLAGVASEITVEFVAAAGNNGADVLHFPAAWRNDAVAVELMTAIVSNVDPNDSVALAAATAITDEVDQMRAELGPAIYAVGSVNADGTTTSWFSNCGPWVNAAAFGNTQVASYPAQGDFPPPSTDPAADYAVWSGTSFAAANFTAALVSGVQMPHSVTGAYMTGPEGLRCPPSDTTSTTAPPPTTEAP